VSPDEAVLVQRLAERLQLPCHVRTAPPGSWPSAGVSAAARAWRRTEAVSLAESLGRGSGSPHSVVALAHHADDQRETVLLKLLRGCHVSRISGMAPQQGPFIRPLLACTKAQLRDFATWQHVEWADDASNADPDYSRRNAVRHRLVPLLQELTGGGLDARLHDAQHQSRLLRAWLDGVPPTWAPARGGGVDAPVPAPLDDDDDTTWVGSDESCDDAPDALASDTHLAPGELDLLRRVCTGPFHLFA
jgi:tRNA(Ile)-lysidine synthetase-like protein